MPSAPELIKKAPVTSLTTVEALTGFTLTFLVTHHVIGTVEVGTTTQTIAPFVSLALPAIFGALKWPLVIPVEKVKRITEADGLVSDADLGRVESVIASQFDRYLGDIDDEGAEDYADYEETGPPNHRVALMGAGASSEVPLRGMAAGAEEYRG